MSRQRLDAVRSVYDEWARGNFRAGGELFDPHVVFVISPGSPEPGTYLGPEEIRRWMLVQLEAWERLTIEAEEFIEAGDTVVVGVRRYGVGSGSGTPVEDRHFHLWTFRGEAVVRCEFVRDREDAIRAVGLEP